MTGNDRRALTWLDTVITDPNAYDDAKAHARTIKAWLKEPRLPDPAVGSHNKILRAMHLAFEGATGGVNPHYAAYCALYAELTKPATKTVEVWHVEFSGAAMGNPYITLCMSAVEAQQMACQRRNEGASCIRVTGPHTQTVPA